MHELSLAQAVVEAVAERTGGARVTLVRLEIGRLSGVVVESIAFCFDLVTEGTALEGAVLEVGEPPGRCRCRGCGTAFETGDPLVLCPACDGADVAVLSGRQMLIASVEVESACAAPAAARSTATPDAGPDTTTGSGPDPEAATGSGPGTNPDARPGTTTDPVAAGPSPSSSGSWPATTTSPSSTGRGWPGGASSRST
ncbi:hydrogenase maturation nickel metallochaperone HypA [Planobispora siamensis]|uniref:Hydrogenase maturation factor HypA n=1 Tax=Planobispora siamensis TaxID=936338 RepID=A0A8J3SJ59_9ACTN|nr:hydrogenase maturation nickel metallochaperone HypA [Planobispora siamensis]GIH93531.1 hypothetical protein Psi01_41610 [Planobispora siamensis]